MEVIDMSETGGGIVILNGSKYMSAKGARKLFPSVTCWTVRNIINIINIYV